MTRVDEINAQIAKLEAEREDAMLAERANVLAKMKSDGVKVVFVASFDRLLDATSRRKHADRAAAVSAPRMAASRVFEAPGLGALQMIPIAAVGTVV